MCECVFQCVLSFWLMTNSSSVLQTILGFGSAGTLQFIFCFGVLRSYGGVEWRKFLNR